MVALTRRALLGAAALVAAGCGDRTPAPPAGGDAGTLAGMLAVARELEGAWATVAAAPGAHRELARDVLARVRAHVRVLERTVSDGAPRPAPAGVAAAAASARATATLDAAVELERAAAAAYLAALPRLRAPDARALGTALHAAAAQRRSALLAALGRDPLPDAFGGTLT